MDRLSIKQRSDVMRKIRSAGTRPERLIMAVLHSMRFRFTANDLTLPGTPDFVLTRHKLAIFVHGCFWHRHSCRRGRSTPSTRRQFWEQKKRTNVVRDRRARAALRRLGFKVLTVWECQICDIDRVKARIRARMAHLK